MRGPAFLLKLADETLLAAGTFVFGTIAGLRLTALAIGNQPVAKIGDPAPWLAFEPGPRSATITGEGIFLGSQAEAKAQSLSLSGKTGWFELSFEGGNKWRGPFLITRLDFISDVNGERQYALTLQSDGEVTAL